MPGPVTPTTYTLDMTGGNGTPFRFVYWPADNAVRYYNRRYPLPEGEPSRLNHQTEDGQACGGALAADDFTVASGGYGIRGWHEVDAWDIDVRTRELVGAWINLLNAQGIGNA